MKKLLSVFALVLLLGACTTTKDYEAQLDRWIGAPERDLIMAYGPPDKQYQLDHSTKMLSYVKSDTAVYNSGFSTCLGSGFGNGFGNNFGGGFGGCYGPPAQAHTLSCETIFTLHNGTVTRWGHKGNDCRG